MPLFCRGTDLDQGKLPVNTLLRLKRLDMTNIRKLVDLLFNLLQDFIIPGGNNRDTGIPGIRRHTCGNAFNIIASSGKKSGNPAQNAGCIINQQLKNL